MSRSKKQVRKSGRAPDRIRIERVQREQIDWDKFAWALLQYCRSVLEAEAEQDANKPDDR